MTPPSSHHAHAPFDASSPLKPPPPPPSFPSKEALELRASLSAKLEEERFKREYEREMMKIEIEDARQKALIEKQKAEITENIN